MFLLNNGNTCYIVSTYGLTKCVDSYGNPISMRENGVKDTFVSDNNEVYTSICGQLINISAIMNFEYITDVFIWKMNIFISTDKKMQSFRYDLDMKGFVYIKDHESGNSRNNIIVGRNGVFKAISSFSMNHKEKAIYKIATNSGIVDCWNIGISLLPIKLNSKFSEVLHVKDVLEKYLLWNNNSILVYGKFDNRLAEVKFNFDISIMYNFCLVTSECEFYVFGEQVYKIDGINCCGIVDAWFIHDRLILLYNDKLMLYKLHQIDQNIVVNLEHSIELDMLDVHQLGDVNYCFDNCDNGVALFIVCANYNIRIRIFLNANFGYESIAERGYNDIQKITEPEHTYGYSIAF